MSTILHPDTIAMGLSRKVWHPNTIGMKGHVLQSGVWFLQNTKNKVKIPGGLRQAGLRSQCVVGSISQFVPSRRQNVVGEFGRLIKA